MTISYENNQVLAGDSLSGFPSDSLSDVTSLFHGHTLGASGETELVNSGSNDWVFYTSMAMLLIFALVRFYNSRRIPYIFSAVFSRNQASQLIREGSVFSDQFFLPLFVVFITSSSLYFYVILQFYNTSIFVNWPTFLLFGSVFLGFLLFVLIKILLLNITGWLFKNTEKSFEYIHNSILFNFFSIILILPLMLVINYLQSEFFVYLSFALIFLLFIYRFFRGIIIGLEDTKFSVLHLFLYLCTLEILPLLIIGKLLAKYVFVS